MIPFAFTFSVAEFWKIGAGFCLVLGSTSELYLKLKNVSHLDLNCSLSFGLSRSC